MFKEIKYYLTSFKDLISKLPLDRKVYKEGTNVAQISYHAAQSFNYWIRVFVLDLSFARDKDKEFNGKPTLEEILESFDLGIEACDLLEKSQINLEQKLAKPIVFNYGDLKFENKFQLLIHGISHLTEHYGELSQVGRERK